MNMDMIMKAMGVDPKILQQLTLLKSKLDMLPKEKQTELMTNFVNSIDEAIKEKDDVKETTEN